MARPESSLSSPEKCCPTRHRLINGDGGQTRDYVFVRDVVRANMLAFQSDAEGPFNVGTGIETDVNRLYALIRERTGYRGGSEHGPAKAGEQYRSVLDCALIKKGLGWEPDVQP